MSRANAQKANALAAAVETPEDFRSQPEYAQVSRAVRPAPPRYRNEIGKFSVRRATTCQQSGKCVELCPHGVHVRPDGYRSVMRPFDYRCIGFECEQTDHYCVDACEHKALSITKNPVFSLATIDGSQPPLDRSGSMAVAVKTTGLPFTCSPWMSRSSASNW